MYGGNAKGPDSGDVTPFLYSMLVKVDASYRLVAPKKLIKEPDSR